MIRFDDLDIYNWHNAIRGMRNSFGSWDKMDSYYHVPDHLVVDPLTGRVQGLKWVFGPNDWDLALRLSKAGDSHAKYLRQILVSVDITAGAEWWKEFDTYKVGTVANSTSLMHKLGSRPLTVYDFSFDDPHDPDVQEAIRLLNRVIRKWRESGKKVGTSEWRKMQKLVPMGVRYTRTVTMNYQVLKTIYQDRRGHRLTEWRDFCAWVESLPYSQLITLKGV